MGVHGLVEEVSQEVKRGGQALRDPPARRLPEGVHMHPPLQENLMGKYFLAWLLGVPIGVLVLIYLFMH